ncbi:OLC1v1002781C1 [Oldenlandia corymbosa var. corymbosa]|uniref:OLC1v1002781C1 n=1 Tax=Oldenlandia corymbosa var. corymbosa TaxID=529605 RepID=A0AAV1D8H8_OLDCO|nr:OLC1v1002781C1 [Oldenlandia corymbosa var. corymbosa]
MNLISTSFSLFMISFVILLSTSCRSASASIVSEVCKNTTDPKFCTETLNADPRSKTADKKGLVRIITDKGLAKGKEDFDLINKLLKEARDPALKPLLEHCNFCYDLLSNRDFYDVIDALNNNDFVSASIMTTSAMDNAVDCEDGFNGAGVKSPLKSQNKYMEDLCFLSIEILDKMIKIKV